MGIDDPAANNQSDPVPARRATRLRVVAHQAAAHPPETRTRRGRLLAVCGLCGGAGASTIAYLTALAAARSERGDVLLADTGGPGGGISFYTGVVTPRSLGEVAELLEAGLPVAQLLATTREGLRVLATAPRFTAEYARDGVELLLDHARERYTLTVIDCGTLARQADQHALAKASHVAWVLPATSGGVERGRNTLDALAPHPSATELLLARHEPSAGRRALRELRGLARGRRAPLILLPSFPELTTGNTTAALKTAQVPLQAILGALAR